MNATVKEVKAWLDMQIAAYHIVQQRLVLTEKKDIWSDDEDAMTPDIKLINLSYSDHVHINSDALRLVAHTLELDIDVLDRGKVKKGDYRYELSFIYNGVKFLAIESEDEHNEREAHD